MGTTTTDAELMVGQPAPGYGDSIGGMTIVGGILGAPVSIRRADGRGKTVDVSLLGVGMWAMSPAIALSLQLDHALATGPQRAARTAPFNPLVGTYRTQDGRFLAFSCLQGFHYWPGACRVVGREDLIDDPRFATPSCWQRTPAWRGEILAEIFLASTLSEWRTRLEDFDGQWAFAQDTLEVVEDPQTLANGYIGETVIRRRHALPPRDDPGAVRRVGGGTQAWSRIQRALRRDPGGSRLRPGQDHRAQGRGGVVA